MHQQNNKVIGDPAAGANIVRCLSIPSLNDKY